MCAAKLHGPSATIGLDKIIRDEAHAISARREALGRPKLTVAETGPNSPALEAVGLALSGGGIRSAAFSLGVLQALNEHGLLSRIDYLSTVSGGGYMGAALSATMTRSNGSFLFGQTTGARAKGARPPDVKDSDAVRHLRNYSNYLIPFGMRDVITAVGIVVRGLVANLSLVLPVVLLFAAITVLGNPSRTDLLGPDFFGYPLDWLPVRNFGITLSLTLISFPLFLLWGLYRSLLSNNKQSEFRTWLPTLSAAYLLTIAFAFFCELQPYVIAGMFDLAESAQRSGAGNHSLLTAFVQGLAAIAAPIAAAVAFFRQQLGALLKSVTSSTGWGTKMMAWVSYAAIWIAGAALPLLIWVAYLYLCYWAIINDGKPKIASVWSAPVMAERMQPDAAAETSPAVIDEAVTRFPATGEHTPKWLLRSAEIVSKALATERWLHERARQRPVTLLYIFLGGLLFVLSYLLSPNANSLHRLYRDRLSKAFLFDPCREDKRSATIAAQDRDFPPLDMMPISKLSFAAAPYHLINAALNVQGSDYANRRGRNADFFLFSPNYVGSAATGYAPTAAVEEATGLDLPTAMAISGAAFSSNMGANSIRALTPTLALLNVRTGYWLKNPRFLGAGKTAAAPLRPKWYLWAEITGRLREDDEEVYITDGGHIENLGIYELLRRRCRGIIAVDAEADPAMRLPSLIALQRYARIDLGVRINLPWDRICRSTRGWMGYGASASSGTPPVPSHGPHAAIGTIDYDGGEKGWLLYIKSSLTGDENDYVRDYARRYDQFPHETTGDQFFSEEQFEVYRALGFHIAIRLFNAEDKLQVFEADEPIDINAAHCNLDSVRKSLGTGAA